MGDITPPQSVLLLLAAFSRHGDALDWARERCVDAFGPLALESDRFRFEETDYYTASMGPELKKVFWTFKKLVDPGSLADIKHRTNAWEAEYAALGRHGEPRPLNLDPGYLSLAKLVLASTKDHAHRIYLGEGIHAEVTLFYKDRRWQPHPWTFADYRRDDYRGFFDLAREHLQRRLREDPAR